MNFNMLTYDPVFKTSIVGKVLYLFKYDDPIQDISGQPYLQLDISQTTLTNMILSINMKKEIKGICFIFYKLDHYFYYEGKLFNTTLALNDVFVCETTSKFHEIVKIDGKPKCTGDLEISYFKFIRNEAITGNGFFGIYLEISFLAPLPLPNTTVTTAAINTTTKPSGLFNTTFAPISTTKRPFFDLPSVCLLIKRILIAQ